MPFYDGQHANAYLHNSLIRYNKEPVYVLSAGYTGEDFIFNFFNIDGNHRERTAKIYDSKTDLTPVPLGFIFKEFLQGKNKELKYETAVVSRFPMRHWKVGLTAETMSLSGLGGPSSFRRQDVLVSKELANTIKGIYPTYTEAYYRIMNCLPISVIPFSRHFAIQKNKTNLKLLYYKFFNSATPVGICLENQPILDRDFLFLNEHLTEELKRGPVS